MLLAIDMGWFVLDKYYRRTDETPVYSTALLLDPSRRLAYLKKNWDQDWIESAVAQAIAFWQRDYKNGLPADPNAIPDSMPPPSRRTRPQNELDKLMDSIAVDFSVSTDGDDFEGFINASPIKLDDTTPLEWWSKLTQRQQYPRLHRMAIAILSIPPESAEAERTFSGARRTCPWYRLRLSCRRIEIVECLGSWFRGGLIPTTMTVGMKSTDPEDLDDISDEMEDFEY